VLSWLGVYWNIKGRWRGIACFWCQVRRNEIATLWRFLGSCATNAPQAKVRGDRTCESTEFERNLAFPTEKFRQQIRSAAKERGFRLEQAFILAACKNELERGDSAEATTQLEARIAATLANTAKQVQSLFTLVHRALDHICPARP
jgi:hypothetical protein